MPKSPLWQRLPAWERADFEGPAVGRSIVAHGAEVGDEAKRICRSGKDALRPQLDELLSLLQLLHRVRPQWFEPIQQCAIRTIPLANPDECDGPVTQEPVINEILILADDDGLLVQGAFPNHRIVGSVESQIKDARSLMTLAGNPPRERGRELRIHEEVHFGCKTAWSDWRAA